MNKDGMEELMDSFRNGDITMEDVVERMSDGQKVDPEEEREINGLMEHVKERIDDIDKVEGGMLLLESDDGLYVAQENLSVAEQISLLEMVKSKTIDQIV